MTFVLGIKELFHEESILTPRQQELCCRVLKADFEPVTKSPKGLEPGASYLSVLLEQVYRGDQ
jgi:hypothetical protein